jgi:hypothetical protein
MELDLPQRLVKLNRICFTGGRQGCTLFLRLIASFSGALSVWHIWRLANLAPRAARWS